MNRKVFCFIILFAIFLFVFSIKPVKADLTGHNGFGLLTPGGNLVSGEYGLVHVNYSGIRLTLVDLDGKRVEGTITADYWDNDMVPENAKMLDNSENYKTHYMNGRGKNIKDSLTTYNANIFPEYNVGNADYDNWNNRDNVLFDTMEKAMSSIDKCVTTTFFVDLKFDLCENFDNVCEDLKKYYLLIEPLIYINFNGHDLVVTATEYGFLIDKYHSVPSPTDPTKDIVYDLRGPHGYGKYVIRGMLLSKMDSSDNLGYELMANKMVYTIPEDFESKNYSEYPLSIRKGVFGDSSINYPMGYGMQIIWLGKLKLECGPKSCCEPCKEGDWDCIKNSEDPFCCYADEIQVGQDEEGNPVCEENDENTNNYIKEYCDLTCCDPKDKDSNFCCDLYENGSARIKYHNACVPATDYFENILGNVLPEVCLPNIPDGPDSCNPNPKVEPEIILEVCDDESGNKFSHFRDDVFNSGEKGMKGVLAEYNSVDALNDYISEQKLQKSLGVDDSNDLLELIANTKGDNSFWALIKNHYYDPVVTTHIPDNEYCTIYCQEFFDVELPPNKPNVNAGQYFTWSIDGDNGTKIAEMSGARVCAVDIDLDKAIDRYIDATEDARVVANNTYNFGIVVHSHGSYEARGVGDVSPYTAYEQCENEKNPNDNTTYYYAYTHDTITVDGDEYYVASLNELPELKEFEDMKKYDDSGCTNGDCNYFTDTLTITCPTDNGGMTEKTIANPMTGVSSADAIDIVYNGGSVYSRSGENCSQQLTTHVDRRLIDRYPTYEERQIDVNKSIKDDIGKYTEGDKGGYSPKDWCKQIYNDYQDYIKNYNKTYIQPLYNNIVACNQVGEKLSELSFNSGIELSYKTSFGTYTYNSSDYNEIVRVDDMPVTYDTGACYVQDDECDDYGDYYPKDTYIDSYFTLKADNRHFQASTIKGATINTSKLLCDGSENNWGINSWTIIKNPNENKRLDYNPAELKMLKLYGFDVNSRDYLYGEEPAKNENGDNSDNNSDTEVSDETSDIEDPDKEDKKYNYLYYKKNEYNKVTKNYWNTIYAGIITNKQYFELASIINACVCKDGSIANAGPNGEIGNRCPACKTEEVDYSTLTDFLKNYSNGNGDIEILNYKDLGQGTLSVEYMNASGYYPIGLKYWTLGSVPEPDSNEGHFDAIVEDKKATVKNADACKEEVLLYTCYYANLDDSENKCRYVVTNKLIAEQGDTGKCVSKPVPDPDPEKCPGGNCEDIPEGDNCPNGDCEDPPGGGGGEPSGGYGDCLDSDGKLMEHCKDLSGLKLIYRIIDLDNPFPGVDGEQRNPGSNWNKYEGGTDLADLTYKKYIENNRGYPGSQLYTAEPLYSFTLTPAAIKEIRRANLEIFKGDYTIDSMKYPDGSLVNGYSLFVHNVLPAIADEYYDGDDEAWQINLSEDERFKGICNTGKIISTGKGCE